MNHRYERVCVLRQSLQSEKLVMMMGVSFWRLALPAFLLFHGVCLSEKGTHKFNQCLFVVCLILHLSFLHVT
uniref:Uncharacterized protein n=1 Tax=Kalanchoe fedtschenkoi TaxID=63787 RepID=A0A7N0VJF1_KALFE